MILSDIALCHKLQTLVRTLIVHMLENAEGNFILFIASSRARALLLNHGSKFLLLPVLC